MDTAKFLKELNESMRAELIEEIERSFIKIKEKHGVPNTKLNLGHVGFFVDWDEILAIQNKVK